MNDEPFSNIESHKADRIGEDIIVTFLPEDVVDGLYAAVNQAGLEVANLTLEPIAAINVAIPESYRLLNIALSRYRSGNIRYFHHQRRKHHCLWYDPSCRR